MSFLVGGMSIGARSESSASTGLTIRERIIRHLLATLQSVQALGEPQPDPDNQPGVASATGGAYTGSASRRYRATIVTAGASGVARVTVTDETPAEIRALWASGEALDDGPVAVVVTSGTAFAVGSLGVTLRLTWSGTLAAGASWDVCAADYQRCLGSVLRDLDQRDDSTAWVQIGRPTGRPVPGAIGKRTWEMSVPLLIRYRAEDDVESSLEAVLGDVERALRIDITRGGWAIQTEVAVADALPLQETKPWGLAELPVTILYRTKDDDPRSP